MDKSAQAEVLRTLRQFRRLRDMLPEMVAIAHALQIPQTVIARESGLSRDGVRKMLARQAQAETVAE